MIRDGLIRKIGEWVVDEATGEQVWQPAEGGPAVSVEEWTHAAEEVGPEADGDAAAADTDAPEAQADEAPVADEAVEDEQADAAPADVAAADEQAGGDAEPEDEGADPT